MGKIEICDFCGKIMNKKNKIVGSITVNEYYSGIFQYDYYLCGDCFNDIEKYIKNKKVNRDSVLKKCEDDEEGMILK